ncbi:ribosomal RNA-processing protein 8-like [Gigantopelta aegis]|uniref:ribosomal RNA-processing protein 8-like n=1 Tax=Gigantopelta aegis TaxID=1735272 RepID=UPI001B88C39F|nr:ribosomal RNA-processing protein 8-like [Gigantopelta aegis]
MELVRPKMDFEETDWLSDVRTDTLLTSLFGTSSLSGKNPHKNIAKESTAQNYNTVESYRNYLLSRKSMNDDDDDDAVVCKKQRKKVKEKRRKKNKRLGERPDEEERNSSDDMGPVAERQVFEQNLIQIPLSEKSCEKPKKKKKRLHVSSSRSCNDDSVLKDFGSKKRKLKPSVVEGNCASITSKPFIVSDTCVQREVICNTKNVPDKDVAPEGIKKSPLKKKRKRVCKRNKYKHLANSDSEKKSGLLQTDKAFGVNSTNKTIKCTATQDIVSVDSKHLNRSVTEAKRCTKNEKALPLLKLHDTEDRKRMLGDSMSKDTCRTPNKHELSAASVKTGKHKKGKREIVQNNGIEMTNIEIRTNKHEFSGIPVKSGKKKLLGTKTKPKEMIESTSLDETRHILNKSLDTSKHTPEKKIPFDVKKLKKYLNVNSIESGEKGDLKLKHPKHSVLKNSETVRSQMDINLLNKNSLSSSANSHIVEKLGAVKKRSKKDLSLREKMLDRLNSARFRYLSEQMYTQTGSEAKTLFENDKEAFQVYHEGYQAQVNKWPLSPLNVIIKEILKRPTDLVVADFGCGEAVLAQSVPNVVYSFDLVALNEYVTACDMAKVPLSPGSADVAVFCLSLMGTNLTDYLCEASRVLKQGGLLKIAEVASRFGKRSKFVRDVERMGFKLTDKNTENKMFYLFDFVKTGNVKKDLIPQIELNPCLYKKR